VAIFVQPMRYKGCHQGRRKVFSPIRQVRAISQKLYSHSGTTAVKSPWRLTRHLDTPPAVSSFGGLRTPAPPCAPHHLHGAGIRKPSHERRFDRSPTTSGPPRGNGHSQDRSACLKRAKTGIDQFVGVCSGMTPNDRAQIRPRRAAQSDRITPISNVPLPRPLQPTLQRRPLGR
jgi:hypothetical protein